MTIYIPQLFHLQWHITQRCNLRCTHCYQESYSGNEPTFNQLEDVIGKYKDSLDIMSIFASKRIRGHITTTGGEPFVRNDFFDLLELYSKNSNYFDFSILTNGTLIDNNIAQKLSKLQPAYVQVSIEGKKETHDVIRGKGSYEKTMRALENLISCGVKTVVSFTAHKKNYGEFEDVVSACSEIGVWRVWSDRLIPCGSGETMKEYMFSPQETKDFFEIMKNNRDSLKENASKTHVAMHRALQFLEGGKNYVCQAGKSLMTIDSNGDVYPCRRMPIKVGNVYENHLIDIYYGKGMLDDLRDKTKCSSSCKSCDYFKKCEGGLRCLSYATTGSPFEKDPGCWVNMKS